MGFELVCLAWDFSWKWFSLFFLRGCVSCLLFDRGLLVLHIHQLQHRISKPTWPLAWTTPGPIGHFWSCGTYKCWLGCVDIYSCPDFCMSTARCRPTRMCPMSTFWGPCSDMGAVTSGWVSELRRLRSSYVGPLFFISSVQGGEQDMESAHMFCTFVWNGRNEDSRAAAGAECCSQSQMCEKLFSFIFRFTT